MAASIITDSLVEFYSAPEIRSIWKQAFDAYTSRSTSATTITATSFEGQSSTFAVINSAQEAQGLMEACREALRRKGCGEPIPAQELGVAVDFSYRPISV